jgi:hypothetical protein
MVPLWHRNEHGGSLYLSNLHAVEPNEEKARTIWEERQRTDESRAKSQQVLTKMREEYEMLAVAGGGPLMEILASITVQLRLM